MACFLDIPPVLSKQMADNGILMNAAFDYVRLLERFYGDDIPWSVIDQGIDVGGEKVHLSNRARGIFKPRQMSRGVMSIKTTEPRAGRINIYEDEETDEGYFRYSLQQGDPRGGGNRHLWEALEDNSPFIYFHAVAVGRYKVIWPCFVTRIDPDAGFCEVVVGTVLDIPRQRQLQVVTYPIATKTKERAYLLREVKVRLHQAAFRANVLDAYRGACALSGLPVRELLEAAHITPDSDDDSSADVSNGIAMSRLHHRAYDSNLIGITRELRVEVSDRLRSARDGVVLEALKQLHGAKLNVPRAVAARPDPERLERRFAEFCTAGGSH